MAFLLVLNSFNELYFEFRKEFELEQFLNAY